VVFGLPAVTQPAKGGYRISVRAPQGERAELGLVLPVGVAVESVAARQAPTVPMYTFPVTARVLAQTGNLARLEVQFPRERAPRELTHWRISPGGVEADLPGADRTRFLGALVHNAFSEDLEVQLDVRVKPSGPAEARLRWAAPAPPAPATLPPGPRLTYTTTFTLPFIEHGFGFDPGFGEDVLVELAFSDPGKVREIGARLNGVPVPVQRYRNPQAPADETFFLELTGDAQPGAVGLELDVRY
jgi:hypothetical protein